MAKQSPPSPVESGSTTHCTATAAIAASTAVPPACKTLIAARGDCGCDVAAMPFLPTAMRRWRKAGVCTRFEIVSSVTAGASAIGPRHRGVQQDIGARKRSLEADVFAHIMAHAADARREDHRRGSEGREIVGVVTGLTLHAAPAVAQCRSGFLEERDHVRREAGLAERPRVLDL